MLPRFARTHTKPLEGFFTEVMLRSKPVDQVTQRPLSLLVCQTKPPHCIMSPSITVMIGSGGAFPRAEVLHVYPTAGDSPDALRQGSALPGIPVQHILVRTGHVSALQVHDAASHAVLFLYEQRRQLADHLSG